MPRQIDFLHTLENQYNKNSAVSVNKIKEVSSEQKNMIWGMIQNGFKAINSRSSHRQDMEEQEFSADIINDNVLKYVAYDNNGSITGFLSVHVGLDSVTWAPGNILKIKQDEIDKQAESYYISTFVVDPSVSGMSIGSSLLKAALTEMAVVNIKTGKNGVAFFDCAEANHPYIPEIAKHIAEELTTSNRKYSVEFLCAEPVGDSAEKQYYYSVTVQER